MARKKKADKPMTYGEFMVIYPCCHEEAQLVALRYLSYVDPPASLCGVEVPRDLSRLTYGQLDDLHDAVKSDNVVDDVIQIITGQKLDVTNEDARSVFGFMNMVERELLHINKLFSSLEHHYTKEEKAAGIEELNFGSFGVLDWYAKRMGIADQNEVRGIAWVRIFQCMKNDNLQQLYERRLNEQYTKSAKRK